MGEIQSKPELRAIAKQLPVWQSGEGQLAALGNLVDEYCNEGKFLLSYSATVKEIALDHLHSHPRLALPRLTTSGEIEIKSAGEELEATSLGFDQPTESARTIAHTEIGLVFVPGVGFDWGGNRLGHGSGHYDRMLAEIAADVPKVGVARSRNHMFELIPAEAHDVKMTHLFVEGDLVDIGNS